MAKKRVFLDECCGEDALEGCFPTKAHVHLAVDFGVRGKEDPKVIDQPIERGCLIITVNKDFVGITAAMNLPRLPLEFAERSAKGAVYVGKFNSKPE